MVTERFFEKTAPPAQFKRVKVSSLWGTFAKIDNPKKASWGGWGGIDQPERC
jgi:hypothetical protein